MKITVFEGTPEEYKSIYNVFGTNPTSSSENDGDQKASLESQIINRKEAMRTMLKRIYIQQGQRDLYRVLAKGELEYSEYLKRMNRTDVEIRGVHGALGRRINNTLEIHKAGLPGNMEAVATYRMENDKTYLSLKPEFLEVLIEEHIV